MCVADPGRCPDTIPDVSHRRVEQPAGARRGSPVSNSAARVVNDRPVYNVPPYKFADAAVSTRSRCPTPTRGKPRSPVEPSAPGEKCGLGLDTAFLVRGIAAVDLPVARPYGTSVRRVESAFSDLAAFQGIQLGHWRLAKKPKYSVR